MKKSNSLKLRKKYEKMEDWFVNMLDQLSEKKSSKYSYSICYVNKDKKIYMIHNKKNNYLWVDHYGIWSYFKSNYSPKYLDVRNLIKYLMEKHLNLKKIKPYSTGDMIDAFWWGEFKYVGNTDSNKY